MKTLEPTSGSRTFLLSVSNTILQYVATCQPKYMASRSRRPKYICHNFMECDYRRVLDWSPDLLDSLIQRMTVLYSSLLHTNYCPQSCLQRRCLVTATKGGGSPSSGFPHCPWPQLPASHSNSSQELSPSGRTTYKTPFPLLLYSLVAVADPCSRSRYLATPIV
jgi:hypothetical protein